ncbi:MAG: T9SS type A sorting domain-containing protein [Bacteroidales bacterium]|nr:T9SS type A sorting domain-containing protein [Bacteroidales bacterium]
MVEAFNMAGEKVHTLRLPDAPLTATLDVRRWPSGTYLLRIHTPQGIAVKKLVVRK